jgi:tetratricopeptide (TPR) repeat protein
LFEALGDMALQMLNDEERARTCYVAAITAAQPLEAKHLPLLEKSLKLQNASRDYAGAARTGELVAAFGGSPAERAARYLQAARDFLHAGDPVRARAAAARAADADPYDVDAVDLASGLAIDLGDMDNASAMLTRLLTAKDDRFTLQETARRALLCYRLGAARAQRGDVRQAIPRYEKAVALAPNGEGATQARRGLVEQIKSGVIEDPARRELLLQHLQAIAGYTGALPDLVAWADELRRADRAEQARAAIELAQACGHTADVHQSAYLSIHKPFVMRDDEPYKTQLDATDRAMIADGGEATLAPIASALAEAAALLWPDLQEALARCGVQGASRVPATLNVAATAMFPRITTVLGAGAVMVYQRDTGPDITVVGAATPIIVLGPRLTGNTSSSPPAGGQPAAGQNEARALIARAVELTRPEHIVFAGLPLADATRLLASVARLFGPPTLRDAAENLVDDEDVQRGHDEMVKAALPVKIRSRLDQILASLPPSALDVQSHLYACDRTADRAALLLGGDAATVARECAARNEGIEHLITLIGHPDYFTTRAKLGLK